MTFVIRAARIDDCEDYLRLVVELGTDDPLPSPEAWARRMLPCLQIAEQDGRTLGFVFCELFEDRGYVRQLVTDPKARRAGTGRRLMLAAAARVRAAGLERWQLNVKLDNAAAIALYASLGLSRVHEGAALRLRWSDAERLQQGHAVDELPPERDAEHESQRDWPKGLLASCRGRNAAGVILRVESAGVIEGLAAFDPRFGGAHPFFASSPAAAASLLRAMHARRADNGRDFIQVFVEGDPALAATILDWGGWVALRVNRYAGSVPLPLP